MTGPREPQHRTDGHPAASGAARSFGPSFVYLVLAVLVLAAGIAYLLHDPASVSNEAPRPGVGDLWTSTLPLPDAAEPEALAASAGGAAASALPVARVSATPEGDGDLTPDLTVYLNPCEKPTMNEVIERLHRAGVTTGVAAFSPPGTSPPLVGLAVPDGFVLPEGFVRHHQTTDDGQDIEPILMFSPDHPRVLEASRQAVVSARDRVVPPELAPPGLPLRRVVIPAALDSARAGG